MLTPRDKTAIIRVQLSKLLPDLKLLLNFINKPSSDQLIPYLPISLHIWPKPGKPGNVNSTFPILISLNTIIILCSWSLLYSPWQEDLLPLPHWSCHQPSLWGSWYLRWWQDHHGQHQEGGKPKQNDYRIINYLTTNNKTSSSSVCFILSIFIQFF